MVFLDGSLLLITVPSLDESYMLSWRDLDPYILLLAFRELFIVAFDYDFYSSCFTFFFDCTSECVFVSGATGCLVADFTSCNEDVLA